MKTSFVAAAALALFAIPAVASAASLQYDPASKDNGASHFVLQQTAVDSSNAAAAKADAARYAVDASSGAVIATHGAADARLVTEVNPSSDEASSLFVQKVVIENPANAAAAKADAARYSAPVFIGSDSDADAAKLRG